MHGSTRSSMRAQAAAAPLARVAGVTLLCLAAAQACSPSAAGAAAATFGKTSVGASTDVFAENRKRVNRYALLSAGSVTKLSVYLAPTGTAGEQALKGIVYADASGKPQALLGVSQQLTFKATNAAGWYDLAFASALNLAEGNYWIGVITGTTGRVAGFRYDSVTGSRAYNGNAYTSGPTNPFGTPTIDAKQTSLYATYTTTPSSPPANTSLPAISGEARQAQTLTEHRGAWTNNPTSFTYQWLQCDSLGASCWPIAGATGQTYVPTAADVGHTIAVQETASNGAGAGGPATSAPTATVVPPPPANTKPPTISGTAEQEQTLTESHGSWTNSPTGYTYQWQQCDSSGSGCTAISGATGQTYVPGAGDVGRTIRVQETAGNAGGSSAPATSAATSTVLPPPPANTSPPTITGTAQQGQTLTEHNGSWTNSPTTYSYEWLRCTPGGGCTPISGATNQTYVPVAEDVGDKIDVQETASNAGGTGAPATSEPTAIVAPAGGVPSNASPPTIAGTAQEGQTLTEHQGSWSNEPTGFAFQWLRCDGSGNACALIVGASSQMYALVAADVGHTIRVQEEASNSFGTSNPATSAATTVVTPPAPANISAPTIAGTAQQGQTLTEQHGSWTNEPSGFSYQWQQCDGSGNNCTSISGATEQTYVPVVGDVGHTIRVQEIASNAGGPSAPAPSAATATVLIAAPMNTSPPTIGGTVQQGHTLTANPGTWTNNPTTYNDEWLRCDSSGANCSPIPGAASSTYTLAEADVGTTVRVVVTATNAGGTSAPATSAQTAVVRKATATFGKTTIGASVDVFGANRKRVNEYALPVAASVSKLSVYLAPTSTSGQQVLQGIIYGDASGKPGSLLGTTTQLTFASSNAAGWYNLSFGAPLNLAAGNYWIGVITGETAKVAGFRYDSVAGSRDYNANTYSSGPTNPFGAVTVDSEQTSLYATYAPSGSAPAAPVNQTPPTISGTAQQGQTLTEVHGSWTNEPTSFTYQWSQCNGEGGSCNAITGATGQSYVPGEADVGRSLRVTETASNAAGAGNPVTSAATAAVTAGSGAPISHLEYVLQNGTTSVYDMDHEFKLLRTISMPQDSDEVRGVSVAPSTHLMYVMHGGDGPANGSGNGAVLAYDLVQEKVLWDVKLNTGIDSGQVSPDGAKLYIPSGENTNTGIWNVLSATNGELLGTVQGGSGAHNTLVSRNGQYVYLGGRLYNFLDVYETATGKVKEIGPLVGTVRPLTANGSNTLAFTTATNFDGFQVSSVTTGKVLFTVSFGEVPKEFPFSAPSHGIGLSPDEKQVYVIDSVHKEVQFWDVSKVKEGIAPTPIGVVPVSGLTGKESPCVYDCIRSGWIQRSLDGRLVFVGDSGEVIETATRKVITTLSTLAQAKKSIEVDWQNGVPIASSERTGTGQVE